MMIMTFTPDLYDLIRPGIQESAAVLVPYLSHWLRTNGHTVNSVVDVGCGEGWWGRTFLETGNAKRVVGVDGAFGGDALAELSQASFKACDLSEEFWHSSLGYHDLAVCLEVAEHLPNPVRLIDELVRVAPVVVFSAAIPDQPGAGHISCRWQHEWSDLFHQRGWRTTAEPFRRQEVWADQRIAWWYRQNGFVAWRRPTTLDHVDEPVMSCVHPDFWAVRR